MNIDKTTPSFRGKDLFLKACFQKPVDRTPVWMMRQAGRYLPEYRAIRQKHDFLTMYKTPELATEVTLQPVDILGVDAAILFSDILVIPEAMGMTLTFIEGKGPRFPSPIRNEREMKTLQSVTAAEHLDFVMQAIKLLRRELENKVPLIGFSGAPWTLATYMIEGGGSKNFEHVKQWRFARPSLLHALLEKVTRSVIDYTREQINAGIQAFQLFDSWAGILDPDGFREFALPYVKTIIREVKMEGLPFIYFAKGAGAHLEEMLQCGADVIGLDWTVDIGLAKEITGTRAALQGNLDPTVLLTDPATIRQEVIKILEQFGARPGHVFNLGHGILPKVPVENARAFIKAVQEESPVFHQKIQQTEKNNE